MARITMFAFDPDKTSYEAQQRFIHQADDLQHARAIRIVADDREVLSILATSANKQLLDRIEGLLAETVVAAGAAPAA